MKFLSSLSFTKKYIFALSLIAILSTLGYLNLTQLIKSQAKDAELINISGKQRMLSQEIPLLALNYKTKSLKEAISLMEKSHNDLISRKMSKKLYDIYFSKPVMLDAEVKEYIKRAKSFLNSRDGRSLSYLLNHSQKILKDLDYAVSIYQQEAEEKTKELQQNELYILLLTLFTLAFEAFFIFRPANNIINTKTKELNAKKEYADMITQINTNAIIAVNSDFEILTFNKSAEKIFGYSADEMLHTKLNDDRIIPLKYLDAHNKGLLEFIKTGKLKHKDTVFQLEAQRKDKTVFPIRISFGTNVEEDKRIVVANIQDISNEKEKDELIIQQSRYAAMGEMIGNIAHQWRQPLSSISTLASGSRIRYKNNLISDEELDETFVKIKEYTTHLSQTIDDFRDFYKNDKQKELFTIEDVIKKSITLVEATYTENNIELVVNQKEKNLLVNGSSSQLSQVFLNILNNAKDVLREKDIEKKVVYIEVFKEDTDVVINITDNAGGIPKDVAAKIYEPYFTTKHKSHGTGIGLFMSKRIVEQLFDGSLSNENREFTLNGTIYFGASFSIRLPIKHN